MYFCPAEQVEEEIEEDLNGESTLREDEEPLSSARQSDVSDGSEPRPIESDSEGVMVVQTRQAGRRKRRSKAVSYRGRGSNVDSARVMAANQIWPRPYLASLLVSLLYNLSENFMCFF